MHATKGTFMFRTSEEVNGRPAARRPGHLAILAALVLGGMLAADTAASFAASPRAAENKLILSARQDPGTLDYTKNNLTALRLWIPANVVEPLVYFNKDGSVTPGVAESWDISPDKLTYTFHIRNAKFSNGAPITADDVVYSLDAMSKSAVVDNASAFQQVSAIDKVDDHTVKVTLKQPSQGFWRGMGGLSGLIQPKAAADSIATNPIGSGPYKLVKYVSNSELDFTVNPDYWGPKPSITDVTVRIITDGTAGLNALEAGELDGSPVNTIDLWDQLTKRGLDKKFTLVTFPQAGEPTYAIVNAKIPLAERQAIAQTLDRQSFNDAFGAPWGAENTCTFAEPNQSWYRPATDASTCPYPYDLDKATAAVSAGGYASTPLTYASLSDVPDLSLPADIMIPEMQAAGFNVTRNAMDLARYSQLIFQGQPPQFDVTIMAGDANPAQWACTDPAKAGWSTYCSPDYTKALADADKALTTDDYNASMLKAADVLRKDAVIIPLLAKQGVGLWDKGLKGFIEPRVGVSIEFAPLHW